jgi:CHAD domain-containing protein
MNDPRIAPLLASAATVAATRIVRDRLDAATHAAERLADASDADALHDFRVALRRLRSALRAYRPWLGRAASRKVRSALRDLGRATNAGRDAEVQAEWLAAQARELPDHARAGAAKLAERLQKRRLPRAGELRAALQSSADKILERLEFQENASPAFSAVYEALLGEHAAVAAARLAAVGRADQVEEAHEARIALKRLRYLLEPLADELPLAAPLLETVKELQDLLGELHDAHVLDETLVNAKASRATPRAALAALAAANATRRDAVFAELERRWLGGAATSFFEQIRRLAARP